METPETRLAVLAGEITELRRLHESYRGIPWLRAERRELARMLVARVKAAAEIRAHPPPRGRHERA